MNVIALPNINIAEGGNVLTECAYCTARYASIASAVAGVGYPTERIAQRITRVFNDGELEKVADNAEGLIRQEFTRTAAIELPP